VADLNAEQFGQLPEFLKGDYEQSGEVYRHRSEGKVSALKASLDSVDQKAKTYEQKLREIEAKSEEDRTKAEQAALDKLKKEGKVDEILADAERRHGETQKQYEARIEKLSNQIKTDQRNLDINSIAEKLKIFDDSKPLFAKLIKDRIEVDPETGKKTYLDENGGATSMTQDELIASLEKDPAYNRMRQANVNSGGNANGNNGSNSGGAQQNPAAEAAKKKGDLAAFINASIGAPKHG
jgi:hypothetical protein